MARIALLPPARHKPLACFSLLVVCQPDASSFIGSGAPRLVLFDSSFLGAPRGRLFLPATWPVRSG